MFLNWNFAHGSDDSLHLPLIIAGPSGVTLHPADLQQAEAVSPAVFRNHPVPN